MMRSAFETMLNQFGQTVRVYTDYGNSKDAEEYRGLKAKQESPPYRNYIKFPDRVPIKVGHHLRLKAATDLWRVVEVEDVTSGDEFVAFQVFVEKVDAAPPRETTAPVFHAPIYGGVQIGGEHNVQQIDVAVANEVQVHLEQLAHHIGSSDAIDDLDKIDATDALRMLGRLSTQVEDPGTKARAAEKLNIVERALGVAANLTNLVTPALAALRSHFGL